MVRTLSVCRLAGQAMLTTCAGDIVYLEVFGHGVLVLNSHAAAVDLLDRRGVKYGDRPAFISA